MLSGQQVVKKHLYAYFKKSMLEIRRDIKKNLLEQQVVGEVQSKIAKNITITPAAIKKVL